MNTAHLSSTKNTSPLAAFADQQIDWNLTPEMAVTLYLEWGNNDWRSEHPPVRSKSDVATYFVVDAWQDPLKVRLVRRNSESADDLVTVPLPEPLRWLEPSEQETRTLHALEEYGIMNVKLYEDIVRHGTIATGFDYPVRVAGRYIMSPSPIPRFDNPKMHQCPALQLFGAGREKRLYAIPPYTDVESLDFEDYPFTVQSWDEACAICGSTDTYLDEVILDDQGNRMFVCSDTDCCARRAAERDGQGGAQ